MKKVNGIDKDVLRILRMKEVWSLNDLPEFSLYYTYINIKDFCESFIIVLGAVFIDEYFAERLYVDNEYNCFRDYPSLYESNGSIYHLKRLLTNKGFKKKLLKELLTEEE